MTVDEFHEAESCMHRSHGHCMTMGTASTMACMVEALGMGMPGNAAIPAVDARRYLLARMAGRRIVDMVREDLTISKILKREAFENAIRANAAIGGSTNAVIHLIALAGRVGVKLDLDDWDRLGRGVHTMLNLMPSGEYLMEDFYYAGGLPVVLRELGEQGLLHRRRSPSMATPSGKTTRRPSAGSAGHHRSTSRSRGHRHRRAAQQPLPRWRHHQALGCDAQADEAQRARGGVQRYSRFSQPHRRPKLDIDENCVMVLKNCGFKGYPGMARWATCRCRRRC
jgi:dihydroxy-acid dehydratase